MLIYSTDIVNYFTSSTIFNKQRSQFHLIYRSLVMLQWEYYFDCSAIKISNIKRYIESTLDAKIVLWEWRYWACISSSVILQVEGNVTYAELLMLHFTFKFMLFKSYCKLRHVLDSFWVLDHTMWHFSWTLRTWMVQTTKRCGSLHRSLFIQCCVI